MQYVYVTVHGQYPHSLAAPVAEGAETKQETKTTHTHTDRTSGSNSTINRDIRTAPLY